VSTSNSVDAIERQSLASLERLNSETTSPPLLRFNCQQTKFKQKTELNITCKTYAEIFLNSEIVKDLLLISIVPLASPLHVESSVSVARLLV
jgi:hypothetical protein